MEHVATKEFRGSKGRSDRKRKLSNYAAQGVLDISKLPHFTYNFYKETA